MSNPNENPNENCLEGMSCPKCKSYGPFLIEVTTVVRYGDDGIEDMPNDKYWDANSYCACCECNHTKTVKEFSDE